VCAAKAAGQHEQGPCVGVLLVLCRYLHSEPQPQQGVGKLLIMLSLHQGFIM
jgi:hypothetical protein